jgi:hypothetical protein
MQVYLVYVYYLWTNAGTIVYYNHDLGTQSFQVEFLCFM